MPFRFGYHTSEKDGTVTMDGAEDTVFEVTTPRVVEGWLDLTNMQAPDTVTVRQYARNVSGGPYVLYGAIPYTGSQTLPMLWIRPLPGIYGLKVTAQQTAGVNRTFAYAYFSETRK
jgi:hypothetical protein